MEWNQNPHTRNLDYVHDYGHSSLANKEIAPYNHTHHQIVNTFLVCLTSHIHTSLVVHNSRLFLKFIYQSISNIIILKNNVEMIRGYSESAFNVVFW